MHKYEVLRHCAEEFRLALEKYATSDSDLEWFWSIWKPMHDQIVKREIRLPYYENCAIGYYFYSGESTPNLFAKYVVDIDHHGIMISKKHPLARAVRNLMDALRDRFSDPQFAATLRAVGESLELIPDELPPPEEEAPLPAMEEEVKQEVHIGHGWLYRWIFGERKK